MKKPSPASWRITTHDWAIDVDAEHLELVRQEPAAFAHGGALHLVLEVLAYAAEEARHNGSGHAVVTLHRDGSVSMGDNGRGTDTRADEQGQPVRKPAATTKDLRFFDFPEAAMLPDGYPRRGMSVVSALSEWLVHTNVRRDGAWTRRYEHGFPVTGITAIPGDDKTGTTVHFLPDAAIIANVCVPAGELRNLAADFGPPLSVEIIDLRD
ncbi:MAG: hypothetical protein ACTHKL_10155 [Streptosporangiaceae bacterium]